MVVRRSSNETAERLSHLWYNVLGVRVDSFPEVALMVRVIFVLCLLGLGWWCNTNLVVYNLMHGLEPVPARKCVLHGARKDGVYFSPEKENISYQLDTHIGTPGQKLEASQRLVAAMSQDLVSKLPEGTAAKVVSNSTHKMYRVPHELG